MTTQERAARERKQKIFVLVGGILLLGLLAFQLPRLLGGSATPAAAPAEETSFASNPTSSARPAGTNVSLTDTDRRLRAAPGQLSSFSEFSPKDPFVQQVVTESSFGSVQQGGGGATEEKASTPPTKEFTVGGSSGTAVTIISVNGARQALEPGAAFPAADPVFVLVAEQPDASTAVIGVAGGAYASGAKTTKLVVGKPLILVNTTTGARYRIVLVAVGNGDDAAPLKTGP
ncbi:MAG TPA: hypothetical protein VI409_05120 [Gaiellaceae bacterium]|nr:hypothetical protein [Gaiellaceae bacterium]